MLLSNNDLKVKSEIYNTYINYDYTHIINQEIFNLRQILVVALHPIALCFY